MVHADQAMSEARRFHRRPVDLRATVMTDGGVAEPCRIANLSVGGAYVALRAMPNGARVRVAFRLPAGEDIDSEATVMWSEGANIGVRFEGLRARQTYALCAFLDALEAPRAAQPQP
jgi:PilZ domain